MAGGEGGARQAIDFSDSVVSLGATEQVFITDIISEGPSEG